MAGTPDYRESAECDVIKIHIRIVLVVQKCHNRMAPWLLTLIAMPHTKNITL